MSQAVKALTTAAGNPGLDGKRKGAPPTRPAPDPSPALVPASVPKPTAKVVDLPPGSYRVRTWGWGAGLQPAPPPPSPRPLPVSDHSL